MRDDESGDDDRDGLLTDKSTNKQYEAKRDFLDVGHYEMVTCVTGDGVQISRLVADSCSLYADCESCVSSQDLLGCVWCAGRCAARPECRPTHFDPTQPYDTHCPPVILHVRTYTSCINMFASPSTAV